MKVLLCSHYKIGKGYTKGGITIWTNNILDYYKSQNPAFKIEIVTFDRKASKRNGLDVNKFIRALGGIIDYLQPIRHTIRKLKTREFDVLHLCTSASMSLFKDLIVVNKAKKYGAKAIVHLHFGRIPEIAETKNWEWELLLRIAKKAYHVITMDLRSFHVLKNAGVNNVHYLPNPLSQSVTKQIEELKDTTQKEKNKICFVGQVIPTKGARELVEACKDISGINLYVVGKVTEEMKDEMKRLAGDFQSMFFLNEMEHKDVIKELFRAEIFILPTYTEGFPNVILESMACGCAIVTTPVGAIPEMLDIESETPCGLCSPPKDVTALRKNIRYFVDNPDKAKEYGQRAAIRVNEMYSMPIVWKQLVSIWTGNK